MGFGGGKNHRREFQGNLQNDWKKKDVTHIVSKKKEGEERLGRGKGEAVHRFAFRRGSVYKKSRGEKKLTYNTRAILGGA